MARCWTGNTRAPWHDYTSRQIYHITLSKRPGVSAFGSLSGDWRLTPGTPGSSYIKASSLGRIIKDCLRDIPSIHSGMRLYQYALMPDHLHIILSVENSLDEILGRKLATFKVLVDRRANIDSVFDKGFNDQILTTTRNLDTIFSYLRTNPYRLAVRLAHPDFFSRINNIEIGGQRYAVYGNLHLLDNPFKEQVVVHRADSPQKRLHDRDIWRHCAANGGVLVSPFVSASEREVRSMADDAGSRVILIVHEAFGERYKPSGHDFDLCCEGRLLIVSLGCRAGIPLTRALCMQMNYLAHTICIRGFYGQMSDSMARR